MKITSNLVSLCAYSKGTPENNRNMVSKNPQIGKPIIYIDLAKDRAGYAFVIVETTFTGSG